MEKDLLDCARKNIREASDFVMKCGAPKESAFCLAISRCNCEQCKECEIRGGTCKGIWEHKDFVDYERFQCLKFNILNK